MFNSSSLVNFFNALIDTGISNLKLHFKKSPLQLENLKNNLNTFGRYAEKVQEYIYIYIYIYIIYIYIYIYIYINHL